MIGAIAVALGAAARRPDRRGACCSGSAVELSDGAAGDLCAAVSRRAVRHARRPAGRHRHHRHADRDGAARLLGRRRSAGATAFCWWRRHAAGRRARLRSSSGTMRSTTHAASARDFARKPRGHAGGHAHAVGRPAVRDADGELFELRADRRPVGRALSRRTSTAMVSTERGELAAVPVLAQIVGSLLWGPMDRVFGGYKLPVLVGAVATARCSAVSPLVGTVRRRLVLIAGSWRSVLRGLQAGADRARQVAVSAASGRARHDASSTSAHGRCVLSQTVSGFVIELFPRRRTAPIALAAYRLRFRPAGGVYPVGVPDLFAPAMPAVQAQRRAAPVADSHRMIGQHSLTITTCFLCGAMYIVAVR